MDARLTHLRKPLLHEVAAGTFCDRGSLISLSHYTTVGSLMGNLTGDVMIEGRFARLTYRMLYRLHQRALHGTLPTLLLMLSDFLQHHAHPRMKLH